MDNNPDMLDFLKAMTDPNRLRIIGVLAEQQATAKEISLQLALPFREVINHLEFLSFIRMVKKKGGPYQLRTDKLESLAVQEFSKSRKVFEPPMHCSLKEHRVLVAYLNQDGTIKRIPVKPGKLCIILDHVIRSFVYGTFYSEKETNNILAHFHEDVAGLRRNLVDAGLLSRERDGSHYWRQREEP